MSKVKILQAMTIMVIGCFVLPTVIVTLSVRTAIGATPGDPAPAARFGAVGVVCDDGGTGHATPIPIAPANGNTVLIQNLDATTAIYCGPSSSVTSANGIQIAPSGGTMNIDIKLNATTGPGLYCTKDACNGATVANQLSTGLNNTRWLGVK